MAGRRPFNVLVICCLALAVGLEPSAQAQDAVAAAPACAGDEYRQFDFWVGDWVVTTPDGQPAGENRIERTLNDCVLVENWQGVSGAIGRSFNMYFARDGKWHQTWVDGSGGRLDLEGGLQGERMVLSGRMPGRDGGEVLHEISWTPRADGTVRQHWRGSRDRGKNWNDLFVGIYTRRD